MSALRYVALNEFQRDQWQIETMIAIKMITDSFQDQKFLEFSNGYDIMDDFIWSLYRIDLVEI